MKDNTSIVSSVVSTFQNALNSSDGIEPIEAKTIRSNFDPDLLNFYVKRYKIEEVNLSNLQKLHEKELINVPFFQKLRKMFPSQIIKSHLMEALGISKSYTGFHEFMRGDRDDLPTIGLCNIAKTVGYDLMVIPIPEDLTDLEMARLKGYQDAFIHAVEMNITSKNIPTTKAKSKKPRPKDINESFLNNLGKTDLEIAQSIQAGVDPLAEKIDANATFSDGEGKVVLEAKQFEYGEGTNINLGSISSDSMFDLVSGGTESGSDFMMGYEDNLNEFGPAFDDDEFGFGGEDDDSNNPLTNTLIDTTK